MKMRAVALICALGGCNLDHEVGSMNARWALSFGGNHEDGISSLAVDPSGDVIAGGSFQHIADFGSGPITSPHPLTSDYTYEPTGFITKRRGADGSEAWTVFVDGSTEGGVSAVASDGDGDIYLIGSTDTSRLVIVLDATGQELWRTSLDIPTGFPSALAVARDTVYVSGVFQGTIDLGDGSARAPGDPGEDSSFLAAFTTDGTFVWSRFFLGWADVSSLRATSDGGAVVAGYLAKPTEFSGHRLTPVDRYDSFLVKYGGSGDLEWGRVLSSVDGGPVGAGGIAILDDGTIGVALGADHDGRNWAEVRTFSADGSPIGLSSTSGASSVAIAAAPDQEFLFSGSINEREADFGTGPVGSHLFVAAAGPDGDARGGVGIGNRTEGSGVVMSIDAGAGGLAIGARLDAGYNFGTGPLTNNGNEDAVLVMLDWMTPP